MALPDGRMGQRQSIPVQGCGLWGGSKPLYPGKDQFLQLYNRRISDDDELARLSDFNLMGDKPVVLAAGHPIAVAWMKGRSRSYAIAHPFQSGRSALSVAFNDHCDAVVATVVVTNDQPATIEPGVIEFLNSKTILSWAEVTLGL